MNLPTKRKEMMNRLLKGQVVKTVLAMIQEGTSITMDQVAARCGVSKGTLYNYFKNKKDLLNYVHEAVITPIKKGSSKIFKKNIPPMEKIYAFVGNVFDFQREYPLYFKFIQSQRSAADAVTERMDVVIIPLVNVCREGMRQGQFMDADPYVMAAMIFGSVVGPFESLTYRDEPLQDLEKLKQEIVRFLDKCILKEQERSS
ncbi:TetR/AcrR family transcriptional regulator [Desulfobacter hydrogenophilus]|uniref:TetR/AcrR family transcriptional regulator n=1 Tax=Desulfobacter hydrogenophilus TaxID=2291 RepID=A0A328F8S7_9BACT|nr:TetR/AcrR family transcriptional regulator [Desulfobacter hydrogenophilus]NDY71398.1 TetR/AcrR family transcriptional regulator [Desulfobacter hydrogenophilus]QBH12138.1 TetR/AcrR family transcriptional regulator [Desulfobacter hydrogenophilus]RAM00050.1 TetR/AcrR family transcriptional regulator [Desulfobacter hydrogenophilus]